MPGSSACRIASHGEALKDFAQQQPVVRRDLTFPAFGYGQPQHLERFIRHAPEANKLRPLQGLAQADRVAAAFVAIAPVLGGQDINDIPAALFDRVDDFFSEVV